MEKLFTQIAEIKIQAERKCRKILRPLGEFSPQIKYWYDKWQAFKALITTKRANKRLKKNLSRLLRRKEINVHKDEEIGDLENQAEFCRKKWREVLIQAKPFSVQHFQMCLAKAVEKEDKLRISEIKGKMNREGAKKIWKAIKHAVKDPRSRSVTRVTREENGDYVTYDTKEDVEEALQKDLGKRFTLANSAPISKSFLGKD